VAISNRPPWMPFNSGDGLTGGFGAHRQAIAPLAQPAADFQFGEMVFHDPLCQRLYLISTHQDAWKFLQDPLKKLTRERLGQSAQPRLLYGLPYSSSKGQWITPPSMNFTRLNPWPSRIFAAS